METGFSSAPKSSWQFWSPPSILSSQLTEHLHCMWKLRITGVTFLLLCLPLRHAQRQLCFYLHKMTV